MVTWFNLTKIARASKPQRRTRPWRDLRPISGMMVLRCSRGTRKAMLKRTMSVIRSAQSSSLASDRVSLCGRVLGKFVSNSEIAPSS